MSRRTLLFSAAGVVVAAAVVAFVIVLTGTDTAADPNESTVIEMCRDAAADQPGMTEGVDEFTVSELTHKVEDGITFYRAQGSAATGDGFGGTNVRYFTCDTKLVGDSARWELIDITLM